MCHFFPADLNGIDLTPVQDTPVALRKEDTYVHFNVDIEIQKHVEKLTKGTWYEVPEAGPRSFGSVGSRLLLSNEQAMPELLHGSRSRQG